jgi:integrase
MALTEIQCKKAICPEERPYSRLSDEKGMYLEVTKAGGKYWRLKYRHVGKEKRLALGVYPDVSLAQARKARDQAREAMAGGNDPSQLKREAKLTKALGAANTFEAIARQWWTHWNGPKSPRHADYVIRRLEADVFPAIGSRPIASVTAPHLLAMAKGIEARGAVDIAKRSLQTCGQVMRYAVAHGYIERNPAADVRPSDALKPRKKENYARLDAKEMPELLRKIEAYQGSAYTRLAMKLMALTFVRTGELIAARWEEFDLDAAEWRIPAARMKMRTPHIVPLSPQAVEVVQALQTLANGRALLFPGERDHEKPMSNNTILGALKRMGYAGRMTGHGFRGVASTVLHELGYAHHLIELQLAHQERNSTVAAYNHATYLKDRRVMMCAWADQLDRMRKGAQVIDLHGKAA